MNPAYKKEFRNYPFYLLRNPVFFPKFCLVLFRHLPHIIKKISAKFFGSNGEPSLQKPFYLKNLVIPFGIKQGETPLIVKRSPVSNLMNVPEKFLTLQLASGPFKFENKIDWEKKFEDAEDYESLHRWIWLVTMLSEYGTDLEFENFAFQAMRDWIFRYGNRLEHSSKWNAYTTSERISNGVFLIDYFKKDIQEFKGVFTGMANHVLENLEYYGTRFTFNHIVNNARALYLYSQMFNSPEHREAAFQIFRNELPLLVTEDGFLREGSSHYQFLFTRWLLEVFYFASRFKDQEILNCITSFLPRLVEKCRFFLVPPKLQIPLIGDVSPDVSPDWLLNVGSISESFDSNEQGWIKLFDRSYFASIKNHSDFQGGPVHTFDSSGWHRFNDGDLTIFFYARPLEHYGLKGHFHSDYLSFCFYLKGDPILIDSGRLSYQNEQQSLSGVRSEAHNSVLMDGFEPIPFYDSSFLHQCFDSQIFTPHVSWLQTENGLEVKLVNNGFRRLAPDPVGHVRLLRFSSKNRFLEISDEFIGQKMHTIETFFHWAPGFGGRVENGALKLKSGSLTVRLKQKIRHQNTVNETLDGLTVQPAPFFPQYGRSKKALKASFISKSSLPVKYDYLISW